MSRISKSWFPMIGVVFVLTVSGCGGKRPGLPLGEVEGVVSLDGEPLAGALIEFNPKFEPPTDPTNPRKKAGSRFGGSVALSGPDGKYVLKFDNERTGAIVGVHSVKVSDIPGHDDSTTLSRVPRKYTNGNSLTFEVSQGKNNFDVQMVSK